uniref:Uncharacterized protein n=1 Tax=Anopheles melas TaxID=34690 RepID=A0A182UFU0_9DIPT
MSGPPSRRLTSNRETGPGWIGFRVLEDVQLYLHDEYSVPHAYVDRSLRETVLWGMRKEIVVRVIEMENKETVHDLPIWRRNCRFPWETVDKDWRGLGWVRRCKVPSRCISVEVRSFNPINAYSMVIIVIGAKKNKNVESSKEC